MDAESFIETCRHKVNQGREEKQYNYRLISSCVLPVLDGEKVHIGRMSATLRCERCRDRFYISRYVFIRFRTKAAHLKGISV